MQKSIILLISALCLAHAATVPAATTPGDATANNGEQTPANTSGTTAAAAAASAKGFKCPSSEEGDDDTIFPFPNDCTKYYECANGVATEKTCAAGFYYNDELPGCDTPENSSCENLNVEEP